MRIKDFLLPSARIDLPKVVEAKMVTIANGVASPGSITFARAPKAKEIIVIFFTANTGNSPGTPAGFIQYQLVFQSSRNNWCYYRVCDGSESATVGLPFTGTSDFKEVYGIMVSGFRSFGGIRTRNDTASLSTPQNVLVATADVSAATVVMCVTQFSNPGRAVTSVSNGFATAIQGANQKSFLTYKEVNSADPALNCTFAYTGGTTAVLSNWIELVGSAKYSDYKDLRRPTFINKGTPVFRINTGAVAIAYPAAIVAGNLLVMVAVSRQGNVGSGATVTPAGWTQIAFAYGSAANFTSINIFTKVATGAETGTETISNINTGSGYAAGGQMYQFSNANVSNVVISPSAGTPAGQITPPTIPGTKASLAVIFTTCNLDSPYAGPWTNVTGGNIASDNVLRSSTSTGLGLGWQLNIGWPDGNLSGTCVMFVGAGAALSAGFRLNPN